MKVEKTKVMAVCEEKEDLKIRMNLALEQVEGSVYMGEIISDDARCVKDIRRRIRLSYAALNKLTTIWKSKGLSTKIKTRVLNTLVIPILLYGWECWTMRKENERRILVAEMNFSKKIDRFFYRLPHIRNIEIHQRLGKGETFVDKVKQRRLKWFGYVYQGWKLKNSHT